MMPAIHAHTVSIVQRTGRPSAYATILIVSVLVPLFFLQRYLGRDLTTAL